ncbi:MAG: FAD-dependent oxidoreductase [Armatimonadota bacterium]
MTDLSRTALPARALAVLLGMLALGAVSGGVSHGAGAAETTPIHPNLRYYEPPPRTPRKETLDVDLCVYGGTSAGVAAAVQAARDGHTVVLVAPEANLGGLSSGGLTWTDFGNKSAIGGLSREFYRRVGQKYGAEVEWTFEPKVAEQVFQEWIAEAKVPVRYRHFLKGVKKDGRRLISLTTERGLTVNARIFIDATYEGDLLARAGVRYTVGRESNATYGETLNGVQVRDKHQFEHAVSPYVVEGDPKSGLLPGIEPGPVAPAGSGDHRVQAYNFRLTLTKDPANRIPFPKPAGYDPREYVLLSRYLQRDTQFVFGKFDPLRGGKVDKNNHGAISTDYIGQNYGWPDGSYREREKIFQRHVVYQQGLMWFLANDPSVPAEVRSRMSEWGLPKDEFTRTSGWPHQLYIREARRMLGDYVMTEHDCRGKRKVDDSVGLGSYGMDSHNCQRVVIDGRVMNEGDVQVGGFSPYPVSYRAIVPKRAECENLLVPVCVSSSHIAYGSIRMEPVFMVLAQSAAVAADMALDGDGVVQNVPVPSLQERLRELGQVLEWTGTAAANGSAPLIAPGSLPGVVLDDVDGQRSGTWAVSTRSVERRVGTGYLHDNDTRDGRSQIRFTPEIPAAGEYELLILAPPHPNRATNAPVEIAIGKEDPIRVRVDLRGPQGSGFRPVGRFLLPAGRQTTITVSNGGTDGYVVVDGVQLLRHSVEVP